MSGQKLAIAACVLIAAAFPACRREAARADGYDAARTRFQSPPAEFRSAPLWVWNDRMTEAEIDRQVADFKAHGIGGLFIHPRPGLITPYLSDEWLSLCRHAVETGKSLGVKIWIYDENSYPSGFGGGHVPARLPDSVRTGLRMTRVVGAPAPSAKPPFLILRSASSEFQDVTSLAAKGPLGDGIYDVFDLVPQKPSPWYGGFTYVDIMRRDVTETFIDVTMNAYKKVIGADFGGTVPGVFQDEAEIAPPGGEDMVNYTPAMFDAFRARWGYDLKVNLPSLYDDIGDWRKVRHDYYATLLDLFIDNWAKPYFQYCDANRLAFTGHYWEHEWPRPANGPDNLAMAAWAHMPGVDILMNEFRQDTHAQFGNARAVKEIRSAANQAGRSRTMSETYGASGWDTGFLDQKRIGDWEYALGVNFLNQHLSYVTIKGARKRDHPLAFTTVEPWWHAYPVLADYFGRLSAALSFGRQENRVLVVEPTTSAWMHYTPRGDTPALTAIGNDFEKFVDGLEAAQVEYDLVSERTLVDSGRPGAKTLTVGERTYDLVVLPPGMENFEGAAWTLLKNYLVRGGRVLSWVAPPVFVDGEATTDPQSFSVMYADRWFLPGPDGFAKIASLVPPAVEFSNLRDTGLLFHHRRTFAGGELLFLVNTDPAATASGRLAMKGGSVEAWDPFTGAVVPHPFSRSGGRVTVDFELPPAGSLLLCVRPRKARPAAAPVYDSAALPPAPLTIGRVDPNVLTLDYCDLVLNGRTERDLYFYEAQAKTFKANGLDGNPWDSAVQYKTNILDKDKFPASSGFEAVFRFDAAAGDYLKTVKAVVERPELFTVAINGVEVKPNPGEWWLDRAFAVYAVGDRLRPGTNALSVRAKPFTIHSELEPVYLLGDFAVAPAAKGFTLDAPRPLALGSWAKQGMPLFGHSVAYRTSFDAPAAPAAKERYVVSLGAWSGTVAEVRVNGKSAGFYVAPPFDRDVTALVAAGANTVEVIVTGSLKNTLGPFHNSPKPGYAWPYQFQEGAKGGRPPGSEYSVVDYGLTDPPRVERRTAR